VKVPRLVQRRLHHPLAVLVDQTDAAVDDHPRPALGESKGIVELQWDAKLTTAVDVSETPADLHRRETF